VRQHNDRHLKYADGPVVRLEGLGSNPSICASFQKRTRPK